MLYKLSGMTRALSKSKLKTIILPQGQITIVKLTFCIRITKGFNFPVVKALLRYKQKAFHFDWMI